MRLAVLSDIHSNKYALENVFDYIEKLNVDRFLFIGDYFGYYPWAKETFDLLKSKFEKSDFIIGNHDELLITPKPDKVPEYYFVIEDNKSKLSEDALTWLVSLRTNFEIELDGIKINACHGTPDDNLHGRFYPDNLNEYEWFPKKNEVLFLGHTHYPLIKKTFDGGLIINPGSIGQSRDNDISSSFCIFETNTMETFFYRVNFDSNYMINFLTEGKWYQRAINSLKKNNAK
jgi:putative phosphoesterase